jgi:hypothetical protein
MPPLYSRFSDLLLLSDRGGSSFSFISSCAFLARLFQNSPIRCNRHVRFAFDSDQITDIARRRFRALAV